MRLRCVARYRGSKQNINMVSTYQRAARNNGAARHAASITALAQRSFATWHARYITRACGTAPRAHRRREHMAAPLRMAYIYQQRRANNIAARWLRATCAARRAHVLASLVYSRGEAAANCVAASGGRRRVEKGIKRSVAAYVGE